MRKDSLAKAQAHAAVGNRVAAMECYQRAVDISPEVAMRLIQARASHGHAAICTARLA